MESLAVERSRDGKYRYLVRQRGTRLLSHPLYYKGSAHSREERRDFGLEGLLPEAVSSMELQVERAYGHITRKEDPLERYIGLAALQDRNEHLFYQLLRDHLAEFLPVVYTPTVGRASREYSRIFRRGRGVWITPRHRGRIAEVLRATPYSDVELLVVTDNEAILGIGDQGAGGMVIPIGKLAIYCAAAGIHPAKTLPVSLDVGTENEALLADDLYLGVRQPRLRGEEYFSLVEELVAAVAEVFPRALLQWEDFRNENAFALLETYRHRVLSFNDDIQGTGAMTLAALLAACRLAGTDLSEQRVVIVGGGAAGAGIALQLHSALLERHDSEEARRRVAVLDSRGLIVDDRDRLPESKRAVAWPAALAAAEGLADDRSLPAVIRALSPTALIGTSGQPGLFTRELVEEFAGRVERPVIFPLSNPTANSEARPEDLIRWTEGRAQVAAGSPFPPVLWEGREIRIGQANNAFVFPGIGLGALVVRAREVSDRMFTAAAHALAVAVTDEELARGQLLPAVERLSAVTLEVALAVARQAVAEGLAREPASGTVEEALAEAVWNPAYPELIPTGPTS